MELKINTNSLPIGVFDSGMGGLTVLSALKQLLPHESFVYLGDMARLPYGTKSPQKISGFSHEITQTLIDIGVKLVVVACNTASTVALEQLKSYFPHVPIVGVVNSGANAAITASASLKIAVLATETTINSKGYQRALLTINKNAEIIPTACPLFVTLTEEGLVEGEVARAAVKHYLNPIKNHRVPIDCVLLACTHFPTLLKSIQEFLGERFVVVDSAQAVARDVKFTLEHYGLEARPTTSRSIHFLVTDSPERFLRVGPLFFGETINQHDLNVIELQSLKI